MMKLLFAGTRGEIALRSRRHRQHSSLVVVHRGKRIVIDCGLDWLGKIHRLRPDAILLTHAHPDHAWGLKEGASCVVYAPDETWKRLKGTSIATRRVIHPWKRIRIFGASFETFKVEHSVLAPAVAYKIRAGKACVFYAPDLVSIHGQSEALAGVNLYVGDGASIARPLVRRRGKSWIGHASIREQIAWCGKQGVPRAIFTHCGSQIVSGGDEKARERIEAMGREFGVKAELAYDGLEIRL